MSEILPIFAETKRNQMKTNTYTYDLVSVKNRIQIRIFKNGKLHRSRLTETNATTPELTNPTPLLDAVISALHTKIKTAIWQASIDGSDPFLLLFPSESTQLLPSPFTYFSEISKRDPKTRHFSTYIARNLEWEELTDRFLEDYKDDLKADDYSDNTIRAYLTGVRVALSKARRDGAEFPSKDFTEILNGKIGTSVGVYLTKSEVEAFAKVETESDVEEAVKMLALIGFYTGARYSDYSQLKSANIVSVEYDNADGTRDIVKHIQYVSEKTSTVSQIPLKPVVLELLGMEIKTPTIQQMNTILPRLGERAGINSVVSIVHGGKAESGPKFKYLKSHSCRRTFAVNVYASAEFDIRDIAKFLGHASTETTLSYISCPAIRRTGKIVSYFD